MAEKNKDDTCCEPAGKKLACCSIESVISIDDRGQMVLPKEIRDKANIHSGDKLAVISMEKDGQVCCISLIKADNFAEMVKGMLGPVMKGIISE